MFLLRETGDSITDICFSIGFTSLGTFSRTFREIVGETPSEYRDGHGPIGAPNCFQIGHDASGRWRCPGRRASRRRPESSSFG